MGTYNNILFGFTFCEEEETEGAETWKFKPLFTDQGHTGCVKTVSCGGRYMASGSTDETIRLFDMKKHVEVGTLVEQDGSITSLVFCGTSHMLSGSEDGTICIWKTKSWELEKVMKGHKGAVNSLSVHPSGRLALSVSKDKSIRTWNLLTGRTAYTTGIKVVGEIVCWSPTGDAYAIVVGPKVTIYKIKGVMEPIVYTCNKYVLAMTFVNESVMLLAGESEDIILYNFEKKIVVQRLPAHKVRTKGVSLAPHPNEEGRLILFTVASDGNLKAWSLNENDLTEEATLLSSLDMPESIRPTCLSISHSPKEKNAPKKSTQEKKESSQAVGPVIETEKSSGTEKTEKGSEMETTAEDDNATEDDTSKADDESASEETPVSSDNVGKKNRKSSNSEESSMKGMMKKKKKKTVSVGD